VQVGQSLEVKGPIPKFPYKANMKKKIGDLHTVMQFVLLCLVHNRMSLEFNLRTRLLSTCGKTLEMQKGQQMLVSGLPRCA
jgi:hypothetical protein